MLLLGAFHVALRRFPCVANAWSGYKYGRTIVFNQGRSKRTSGIFYDDCYADNIPHCVCNICLRYLSKFHHNFAVWNGSTTGKVLDCWSQGIINESASPLV